MMSDCYTYVRTCLWACTYLSVQRVCTRVCDAFMQREDLPKDFGLERGMIGVLHYFTTLATNN